MRTTYITATVIAVLLIAWLGSGFVNSDADVQPVPLADQSREEDRVAEDAAPTKVRVTVMQASAQNRLIKVRGKTDNKRTVEVKVELTGTIVNRPIERGTQVAKNDLLCELSIEDRQASFIEAREGLNQARIEYQGALSLKEKGYNSDTAIAGAKARLASAEATLSRSELDLGKVQVRAPFAGIVEDVHQEIGDYVVPGASCATVIDMHPMLLVGRVSEQDVIGLQVGQTATGYLRNGMSVIIFPQTTRIMDFDRKQFNSMGVKLAKRAQVPVVPIALKTDAWGVGKWIKDLPKGMNPYREDSLQKNIKIISYFS